MKIPDLLWHRMRKALLVPTVKYMQYKCARVLIFVNVIVCSDFLQLSCDYNTQASIYKTCDEVWSTFVSCVTAQNRTTQCSNADEKRLCCNIRYRLDNLWCTSTLQQVHGLSFAPDISGLSLASDNGRDVGDNANIQTRQIKAWVTVG